MRKIATFILLTLLTLLTVSCYTDEYQRRLQEECKSLNSQISYLQRQRSNLDKQIYNLNRQVGDLNAERLALQSGRNPNYIVKFKIKQGTFTMDIFEHAKNEMNAIVMEIPVNKEFYNKLSIGQDITDKFKWGSLLMDGDFSTLHMKVVGKRVE